MKLKPFIKNNHEEEAIQFIQEHEPPEGYFLGFSGGKDSIVMKHLADLSGVKYQAYYAATGIDPPEIVKFIREHHPDVIFKRPHFKMPRKFPDWEGTHSFFGMIPKKGYPTRFRRWCCDELKKKPTDDIPLKHRLMGIRAEESSKRASRMKIESFRKKQIMYKPIFSWLEWEIWEFIETYKLPYCSLYDEGFSRIGCVICPMFCGDSRSKQQRLQIYKARWPKFYVAFEKSMKKFWVDIGPEFIKKGYANNSEEFLQSWYNGNGSEAKSHKNRHRTMFD